MASKYLTAGGPTFTVSTRTLTGGTYSAALASADAGRGVAFVQSGVVYYSRIAKVTGVSTAVLHKGTLPVSDGSPTEVIVLDMGETHDYSAYITAISDKVRDDALKLTASQLKEALTSALAEHQKVAPNRLAFSVIGDGTGAQLLSSVLGGYWKPGFTFIEQVEYPTGNLPPSILDGDDWSVYDDGTAQDASNLKLQFLSAKPSATETFIVTASCQMERPEVGAQNFPDNQKTFEALTLLAASYAAVMLAAVYAQTTDSSIGADVVNYGDKSSRYLTVAKQLRRAYNLLMFGAEDPPSGVRAVLSEKTVDMLTQEGSPYLFHRMRR
jgi:hypothetical protein